MPNSLALPKLETERLTLRIHLESDLDHAATLWSHPDVVRHIGGRPFSREEVWHRILRYRGGPYGYWAITDRGTGEFLGEIGLADWQRMSLVGYRGLPEAGWVLLPSAQGRGFAAEALRCVLQWSDATLDCDTICVISSANVASKRLADSAGYRQIHDNGMLHGDAELFLRSAAARTHLEGQ